MKGKYIATAITLAALAGAGCGLPAGYYASSTPTTSPVKILNQDLAYIVRKQRAGKSYGARQEHEGPGGKTITDGFRFAFESRKELTTLGTVISPDFEGLARVAFCDGNIVAVTCGKPQVDRLIVTSNPYNPENPNLDPDVERNIHPGDSLRPIADRYLRVLARTIANQARGNKPDDKARKTFEAARTALLNALSK